MRPKSSCSKFFREYIEFLRIRLPVNSTVCLFFLLVGCVPYSNFVCAQTTVKQSQRAQESKLRPTRTASDISPDLGGRNLTAPLLELTVPQLDRTVKVVFDRETDLIVLIGSREDIEKVKQTILWIDSRLGTDHDPITEKIRLRFQLSDTVAEILSSSSTLAGTGLQVRPLHFPEAVLLTGRSSIVERAKSIIREIDSHPNFER